MYVERIYQASKSGAMGHFTGPPGPHPRVQHRIPWNHLGLILYIYTSMVFYCIYRPISLSKLTGLDLNST